MSLRLTAFIAAAALCTLLQAGSALAQTDGETLFAQNCSACHQVNGKGIPGAFPALAANPFVIGPPQEVSAVVLNGRGGMPTFGKDLSDDQVAAILTYVRSAWGNKASPVAPAAVASVRNAGNKQQTGGALQAH